MPDLKTNIQTCLNNFVPKKLRQSALDLLATLGYSSDKTVELEGSKPQAFLDLLAQSNPDAQFDKKKALFDDWTSAELLFQLTDEELSAKKSPFPQTGIKSGLLRSYLFFAIELNGKSSVNGSYARGKLTDIARQINRVFPMPVMVLIKHSKEKQPVLSIAVINRRQNNRDTFKDVLGKVTIIRDISLTDPHHGHLDILKSFAFDNLEHPKKLPIHDFDSIHAAWEQIFNVELLNNRFYKELSNWYFWALPQVEFPADLEPDDEKRRATGLIRLLTRLIFCWFLKEKGLIPEKLFHTADLDKILKGFDPESETSSTYYQGILQNLFFATLNQRMGKDSKGKPYRVFAKDEGFLKNKATYDVNNLYRYESLFLESTEEALAHFADIPFLNGGLFECLDRTEGDSEKKRYLDGFSRNAKKRPHVPDHLFFDSGETADLSSAYGDKKRKTEQVTGLITILNSYKFTIVENTPIDQEIALDPELLGKVFENLLASYNEETKTTARKQTGSFYTPRTIVDYMVNESLKAHLARVLVEKADMLESKAKKGLDNLFSYTDEEPTFTTSQVNTLIAAIDQVKILDPACGSGAFPMGVLHKLVYILGKLDRDNEGWKQTQLAKLDSAPMREALEAAFEENNDDYGRKLYLIENCLYGVDIQPIAIQITKLRFFISLVCDQKTNRNKKDNHGIRPLPNLETKFVAANSLIGLPIPEPDLFIKSSIEPIEREIEKAYHSHFAIQRRDQKLALQKKIKNLRLTLSDTIVNGLGASENSDISKKAHHLAEWDPFDPQLTAEFFDPHWMFGISVADGFDITIGNPPYVRADEQSAWNRFQREQILASGQYETLWEKWDLYVPFMERSFKLLRAEGISTMIVSDAFCRSKYAQKPQNWFLKHARILRLDFCGEVKIFDAAVHNIIYFFQRAEGTKWKPERRIHDEVFGNTTELSSSFQGNRTNQLFYPDSSNNLEFTVDTLPIGHVCYVSYGCRPNSNEKKAKGLFVASDLVSSRKDSSHPKPYVEAKEAKGWVLTHNNWLEWGTERSPALLARPTFEELFEVPQKLVAARVAGGNNRAYYDDRQIFHNHTLISFVPWHFLSGVRNNSLKKTTRYISEKVRPDLPKREELEFTSERFEVKYLLGVMNSNFAGNLLRANRRSNTDFYPDDWKKLQIPDVSVEQQRPIVNIVNLVIALQRLFQEQSELATARDSVLIEFLESVNDALVRELYTPEELHNHNLYFGRLVIETQLPSITAIRDSHHLQEIRSILESAYNIKSRLRAALFDLGSLSITDEDAADV
ncbi:hypothetical protein VDG1235_4891 [Verrucomicrobiia bacterium DG1235]|nr:hypothetical protein VDG1235_4891 [Verrucomicrobiae bacterium DG1235]